jgi:hypothetical protein
MLRQITYANKLGQAIIAVFDDKVLDEYLVTYVWATNDENVEIEHPHTLDSKGLESLVYGYDMKEVDRFPKATSWSEALQL